MKLKIRKKTVSILTTVLSVFIIVVVITAGIALGLQYYFSLDLAKTAAGNSFNSASEAVSQRILSLDRKSADLVNILCYFNEIKIFPDPEREKRAIPLMAGCMKQNPSLYAIYVGYENGDLFELVNLESGWNVRKNMRAAPHDRWVAIKVTGKDGDRKKTFVFYDRNFKARTSRQETSTYDAAKRPWYMEALGSNGIIKTKPYIFSNLKLPGITYAKAVAENKRVVAVDIHLGGMAHFLQEKRPLPQSETFLFDDDGNVTAQAAYETQTAIKTTASKISLTPEEKAFIAAHPVIRASNELDYPPFDFTISGSPKGYSVDLLDQLAQKAGINIEYVNGYGWSELVELFKRGDLDILHSLLRSADRETLGIFTKPYLPMHQAFVYKAGATPVTSFDDLDGKIVAIPQGWGTDAYLAENFPGIKRLHVSSTLEALRAVSDGRAAATLDSIPVLHYLMNTYFLDNLKIGSKIAQLSEDGSQGLHFLVRMDMPELSGILEKAMAVLSPEQKARMEKKWFGGPDNSEGETVGVKNTGTVPRDLIELAKTAGFAGGLKNLEISGREYFAYAARLQSEFDSGEYIGFLVPVDAVISPYMTKVRFSLLVTLAVLLLLYPLVWYCARLIVKPINALALENEKIKKRRYKDVKTVKSRISEIVGLSRSLVEMAWAIRAYEKALQDLMDAFIRLIAIAIDRKSQYTGGHCERVPEISMMLAKAASESVEGPFAGFNLETEDEWIEFRTAAWLHDCGKVTTPEYIVDKGTKLETIYNRIHEVRMRFEVLLRDAQIDYWRKRVEGKESEAALARELEARKKKIMDDFIFISECNMGGGFMAPEKIERVKKISEQKWLRHLNDRIGLSHIELARYPAQAPDLPVLEPLLADRPEHIVRRQDGRSSVQDDSHFELETPEHLYNLGEIYNLCIVKGTLSPEDRFKIMEHSISTIRMLETLPYPENMTKIPEYAGAHHETLIGTGYPRKLVADQISIPARIMALADIFEALTASDRPYKKAKKLSEAVNVLGLMVEDKHIDKDLFLLFLTSGIYMEYGKQYLQSDQLDDVDVAAYLAKFG